MGVTHWHQKMRAITHCPICQTQFFVTEEQLNKHDGFVRCGQCLHVFDAKAQFIATDTNTATIEAVAINTPSNGPTKPSTTTPEWAPFHAVLTNDVEPCNQNQLPIIENTLLLAASDEIAALAAETKLSIKRPRRWQWVLGSILLLAIAVTLSIYFLRDTIAMQYPKAKPSLVELCQQLACNINPPKQIEFIAIDDSDMQEDVTHTGLIHLSSTLINKAGFDQAHPNLGLTLTSVDDKPILRRIFKPSEYLPANSDIVGSFKAGEEVRIKLAITTQGISVAGYRVDVSY